MMLDGIRVIELAEWVAAPTASVVLGDFGADVIKIERLEGGDAMRGIGQTGTVPVPKDFNQLWELHNRNKRSVALDIKKEEGKEIVYKIAKNVDIFISNFRVPTLEKLGYDYSSISRINPGIIYLMVTGYGTRGPSKNWPGLDETAYWTRAGIMGLLGEPDAPPPVLRGAMGDLPTAIFAVAGIALALYHREKTGLGQQLEVSLLNSGIWAMGIDLQTTIHCKTEIPKVSRKEKINPLYNNYRTKDNRWIMFSMPQSDKYWPGFCEAIGRQDLRVDPRFDTHQNREQNHKVLISILDEVIGEKSVAELRDKFIEAGLVWDVSQTMSEVVNDLDVLRNEYIIEYDHPTRGRIKGISSPIKFSETPAQIRSAAPELGQHTEEILQRLGYTWAQIVELKDKKIIL
jgi:crotonobetainyl-CoA:carnitine CoA-transferase CaiB-like acyl-CoA transferase